MTVLRTALDAYKSDADYWKDEAHRLRAIITESARKIGIAMDGTELTGKSAAVKWHMLEMVRDGLVKAMENG